MIAVRELTRPPGQAVFVNIPIVGRINLSNTFVRTTTTSLNPYSVTPKQEALVWMISRKRGFGAAYDSG